LAQTFMALY